MVKRCNDATVYEGIEQKIEEELEPGKPETKAEAKKEVERAERVMPDSMWASAKMPFQDGLGLTPARTMPERRPRVMMTGA